MRAAVAEGSGVAPTIEQLELEEPRAGEVRVRMGASGVCHSDLHVRDGHWARPGPVVLGHEGAGSVEAIGPGVDPGLLGRLVALSWYAPCLRCAACQRGRQWACSGSASIRHVMPDGTSRVRRPNGQPVLAYLGIGTFAEAQVVPVEAAIPMPDGVPAAAAALIGCGVTTGVGAVVRTAQVEPGSDVAVIGLGGVGLSCVMGAVLAGAGRIVVADLNPAKLELARSLGATHAVLVVPGDGTATAEAIREATEGGPDYAFDAIGRPETIELTIGVLPPGGTAVLVGLSRFGERASFDVFPFVDGSRRILGSNYGFAVASVDFPRYGRLFLEGRLPIDRLIDRHLSLDDLEDAFDRLRRGEVVRQVVYFGG
jgi:Zn-dependent alcohol dehydrogenase